MSKKVAVIMGSDSDFPVLEPCIRRLKALGIETEVHVMSAHRTPAAAGAFAASARDEGFGVVIAAAGKAAHLAGVLVSYDPNYRPALWRSEAEAAEWMRVPLPLVDVIKLSEEELPLLTGSSDLEEGSRLLAEQGISLVLVTLGGAGSFCRWQGECFTVPGVSVKVTDTNGAGDTFLGAVLSRLSRRGERPLEGLTGAELRDILDFANRAAALTCARSGAIPAMPLLDELSDK